MKLGYARVSNGEQDLSGQLEALRAAGCQRIYSEKKSGGNDNRAALQRMLKELQPGDVVVVTRLDRLTRSTRDLLNLLDRFGQDEVGFQSLRETAIDTTTPHGRLTIRKSPKHPGQDSLQSSARLRRRLRTLRLAPPGRLGLRDHPIADQLRTVRQQ